MPILRDLRAVWALTCFTLGLVQLDTPLSWRDRLRRPLWQGYRTSRQLAALRDASPVMADWMQAQIEMLASGDPAQVAEAEAAMADRDRLLDVWDAARDAARDAGDPDDAD